MFNPTLQVIAAQPRVLTPPDLSFEAILKHFPGIAEAEAVCMTGSTAAGWGNSFSDIDLFVFSDRELELPIDETMETWPGADPSGVTWTNWMGVYDNARVDLKVWSTSTLSTVLASYLDKEAEFCAMGEHMKDFVYRLSVALPLKNEEFFQRMNDLIDSSSYKRALARTLKSDVENQLTDVAGQLASGDFLAARASAVLAAGSIADACLVLAGQLCRRQKWLLRRLDSTPACGISVDEYRSTVLDGARPGESDGDYAHRVARWAQAHLVRLEDAVLSVG
ncbi:nucleotidyltransferase domain-containing protein [Streptomyces wedmorensis]|uniref:nucleotidyltransferase domain-containing protein n=1 Tax=Streptomyces wedmorensis TaxID=43759 RepID=UPI00341C52FB